MLIKTLDKSKKYIIGRITLWIILLLPHLNPPYIDQIDNISTYVNVLRLISCLTIILLVLFVKRSISKITLLICIMFILLVFNTALHVNTDLYGSLTRAFSICSIVLFYDYAISIDAFSFTIAQLFCFELVIYLNLISELLFPLGMYYAQNSAGVITWKNWFLGYYNNHTQYYIPALLIGFIYLELGGKKIRIIMLSVAILVSTIIAWSGGGILSLLVLVIAYFFFPKNSKLFNYWNYWLMQIVFYIVVMVFRVQSLFQWFIEGALGKWKSFEVRVALWDNVRSLIRMHPLTGHGFEASSVRITKYGFNFASHAHNLLLEVLYEGGIFFLVFFSIVVIIAGRELEFAKSERIKHIISTAFFGWCIHSLVEPFMSSFLMGMFIIAYKNNCFEGKMINENELSDFKKNN